MSHPRSRGLLAAIAVAAAVSLSIAAGSASAASPPTATAAAACPGTFQVLHNDHVGSLSLPAGPYVITANNISCTQASSLFTTFLNQWTGKLPGGWVVTANGFRKGSTSFTVARSHHVTPSGGNTCPGQFSVLHSTRIGRGSYAQGNYTLTLLKKSTSHFSCQTASRTFAYFLNTRYSKPLPYPWVQNTTTKTFTEKTNGVGFHVAPVISLGAPQTGPKVTAGGGQTVGIPCRPLYKVASNSARIDNFVLDKGTYRIWAIGTLSCTQARKDVVRAVALRTKLPKGWKHNVSKAIVTVGPNRGFRLKLANK